LGSEDEKDAERWRGMRSNEEQTRRKRESEVTIQIFGTKADRDWEESFENNISVEVCIKCSPCFFIYSLHHGRPALVRPKSTLSPDSKCFNDGVPCS